ncbi:MAG: DUF6514 family protein [Defluviitaleaceae bacterium]|nr:DUF6514 family protein [Defluviitaleaceae bacterium]
MESIRELIMRTEIYTDSEEKWQLSYYLTTFKGEKDYYGLAIERATPEGKITETEETPAFSEDIEEATTMAKAFARGTVLPYTLLELTDEWLSIV